MKPSFWTCYWAVVKVLWTSPMWYVYLAAPFIILGGKINHPERVIPGIFLLGFVFFPAMGFGYFKLQRAAQRRGHEI